MPYDSDDTIAAIATVGGGAMRGMVRVSGPATRQIVAASFRSADGRPLDRLPHATAIAGEVNGYLGDAELRRAPCDLFFWPTDRSYTRQPVAEFHTFGSEPLLRAILESVCLAGARLAEPGEFTLRAFLSGRIDLTQAEAVLGLIDAKHASQLETALEQLAGGLARPLHRLRDELLQLLAELEAGLDFVDEDIEFISAKQLVDRLTAVAVAIRRIRAQMTSRHAEAVAHRVVLVGPPNAGKSSLFNALVDKFGIVDSSQRRDAPAIVSDQVGTTRDYLTAAIDVGGSHCELADTAGLDATLQLKTESGDCDYNVSTAARARSAELYDQATVRVVCVDVTSSDRADWLPRGQTCDDASLPLEVVVLTKADLAMSESDRLRSTSCSCPTVVTSSVTGRGLDELRAVLASLLTDVSVDQQATAVAATADRCRDSLRLAEDCVSRAVEAAAHERGDELVAAELRVALGELGRVVGAVYTDDLLDRIFKTFCIGK